jgi:hypothetical protein
METQEIIKLWKELKVDYVNFEFSCGGDSMNETSIQIYDEKGSEISCSDIETYIDDNIYRKVEFYEASDGHYMGEAGSVEIRLNDEEDDFDYAKSSQSEWCERITENFEIELTDDEVAFIKSKVLNINGGDGDFSAINYKADCILTDKEEEIVEGLETKLDNECQKYEPNGDYDCTDWYRFTTNEQGEEITIKGNNLVVEIEKEYYSYNDE